MKTYYLIAEDYKDAATAEIYTSVKVSDVQRGTVLMAFKARRYGEAVKRFSFSIEYCGKAGLLSAGNAGISAEVI